ncbi:uncharacterized protein LOC115484799 isoform X2 [Serinus canaria]|uniref:uncharacterized protein LOC115484799 isoform X2 n=1 Tax=Serinus canaria TaxID=9135 RepID=UPI0021CD0DB9|nr:uncharacterized protein LOC115484799 isoform X2 [Serinus canaria]
MGLKEALRCCPGQLDSFCAFFGGEEKGVKTRGSDAIWGTPRSLGERATLRWGSRLSITSQADEYSAWKLLCPVSLRAWPVTPSERGGQLHNPGAAGRGGFVVEDPGARCACLSLQFQGAAGPKVCTHPCTALVNSVNVKITRAGSVPWVTTSDEGFWDGAKAVSPSAHWFFFRKNYARAEKLQWHRSSLLRKCPGSKARPSGAIQLRHSWEHQGLGRERWSSESPRSSRGRWRLQRHRDGIHVPAPSSRGRKLSRQFHAG